MKVVHGAGEVPPRDGRLVADVQIKYPWAWMATFLLILPGAGLMLSPDAGRRTLGIVLMLVPVVLTSILLLVFYLKTRSEES